MNAPRRLLDDPEADEALRDVLRAAPGARGLDQVTRRRLRGKVTRAAAAPAAAAAWLFVKSAGAALGVVLGIGAVAVATGVIAWSPSQPVQHGPPTSNEVAKRATLAPVLSAAPPVPAPEIAPALADPTAAEAVDAPTLKLNPTPALPSAPAPSASGSGTLSAEAALLERARREMRGAPAVALSLAAEHAEQFPRGQLAAERTLIQIEALHRLGRDERARTLARSLLAGAGSGLYRERVQQLLGKNVEP